ncbi:MAG: hypothetical protein RBS53_01315 [Bacteroidales bacterium]|jgi:hypothetical protein|nr:hypothetical protein [Bacteroidales bacterium]NLM91316.1 hypothetical protein [Bacteroidales bacterium]
MNRDERKGVWERAWLIILGILVILAGCQEEQTDPEKMYYSYFPDTVGQFVLYAVDSVVYDDFTGQVLHFEYEVKELIKSRFTDGEGKESLRLERYIRSDGESDWEIKDIWQARVLPDRAEKTEENITYIKLVFPPKAGSRWNGNAYNTLPEQGYRVTEAHKPYLISPSLSFDSTVTVLQNDITTLISEEFQEEKYAKNVGLVFKRYKKLEKEPDGSIVRGVDYSYQIKAFGQDSGLKQ